MHPSNRFVTALALAALSASSYAATTVYTSSASFLAQVGPGFYTETFDGMANPPPGAVAFSGGGLAYTVFAPSDLYASGDFLGTSQIDEALTVTFTSGNVKAVGGNFYATNISDVFQAVSVTLTLSDGTVSTFMPTSAADSYRGFISDAVVTSLTFSAPGGSLYAGIDNLTVAAVPEPTSALLMTLGAAAVLAARRRRA